MFNFLDEYVGFAQMFDQATMDSSDAYQFQAERELGYPDQRGDISAFQNMLTYYDNSAPQPSAHFNPASMQDIAAWVKANGDKMLFIYGSNDPWTAGAYDFGGNSNIHKYLVQDGNHGAEIRMLNANDKAAATAKLDAWLGAKSKPVTTTTLGLVAQQRDFKHLKSLDLQRIKKKIEANP